ncbi:MAG: glycosyltransferase [Chitinophagaceae bacterium]|nr:glycosyltransferase [Chitinophagaceae bacterium]
MKYNDKTLVILTPAFPENESATYWVPSQQLMVKALKKNYPHWHIIVLSILYPYHESTYNWHKVQVISFDGTHKRKLRRIVLWRNVWQTLNSIRRQRTIAGLFSFWCGECAFIGKYFGKRYSIKHYSWICGQDARKTNNWIRFIRPREHELVAMSFSLANEFKKNHGIKPSHIIPNAIDPDTFPAAQSKERTIDIFGAGSFEPLKQYDVFTGIVASLQRSFPGIRAIHCGIGREHEKVEALIKKFGIENNFQLLGAKTHEEVLQLMQLTKVFLHTSDYEGFSTVCLEALYAGAQVVRFRYPLDHPVPHWHVVNNVAEMTAKTIEILQNPSMEHEPVLLYSMDDSAKAVMKLFQNESGICDELSHPEEFNAVADNPGINRFQ